MPMQWSTRGTPSSSLARSVSVGWRSPDGTTKRQDGQGWMCVACGEVRGELRWTAFLLTRCVRVMEWNAQGG